MTVKQVMMAMTVAVTLRSLRWNVPMSEYLLEGQPNIFEA